MAALDPANQQPFTWLSKSTTHRGVVPIATVERTQLPTLLGAAGDQGKLLQARVADPFLIDAREFDVGVYVVALRQPDGALQYELFDDILLRFCRAPSRTPAQAVELFATNPKGAEAALYDAWVVDDSYRSAWQVAELRPALSRPNGSAATALAGVVRSRGLSWTDVWGGVQDAVSRTLAALAASGEGGEGAGAARHYDLMRFDFKLDVRGKPWLLEVNSNPNLVPKSDEQAAVLRRLCRFLWAQLAATLPATGTVKMRGAPARTAAPLTTVEASALRPSLAAVRAMGSRALSHEGWHNDNPHSHNPHGHNPHSHNPHGHNPHSHTPHTHTPHTHTPHTHTPHSHAPSVGATATPSVSVAFTLAGTVAAFDAAAQASFKTNLASTLSVAESQISLSVEAASIKVTATVCNGRSTRTSGHTAHRTATLRLG